MAEEESALHSRLRSENRQPMSLNQRHRILIDLSATSAPKPSAQLLSGRGNGENQGRGRLCDDFPSVAENDDIPNFSGITDFDSSPPPPKTLAGEKVRIESVTAEEADIPNFSGIADFDSPFHPHADEMEAQRNVESPKYLEEDDNIGETMKPSFPVTSNSILDPQGGLEGAVKVRIEGRRRLCKISKEDDKCDNEKSGKSRIEETKKFELLDFDSPPPMRSEVQTTYGRGRNEIRDILDDLSSRLEILSIEKKREPKKIISAEDSGHPVENTMHLKHEEIPEYGSAGSSFAISSDSSLSSGRASRVGGASPNKINEISDSDNELDGTTCMKDGKGMKFSEGLKRIDEKVCGKSVSTRQPSTSIILREMEEEEDDDDCVLLGGNNFTKKVERRHGKLKMSGVSNEVDTLEDHADDFILENQSIALNVSKSKYRLPGKIAKMLFPHQREGMNWLWSLHCKGKGGILGDDMGLGKTMQICGFLAGLFHSSLIKRALIVAPKTLLPHWIKELSVVGLSEKTREYFGTNVNIRQYELQYVLQDKGVLLTTYDIVRNNAKSLSGSYYYNGDESEDDVTWDYIILDEGHLIKNPSTQRAKSLLEIPAAHRIIISGTPLQNNLKELWALFNFSCPELLGDYKWFKDKYEKLINRGNEKNASDREKRIGSAVAKDLRDTIQPYFLRRLKSEVFGEDDLNKETKLSKKSEIIVWLKLSSCQRQIYEAFLKSEIVLSAFDGSPLAALTILKKICDHPLLLTKRAAEDVLEGMDSMMNQQDHGVAEKLAMHIADVAEKFDIVEKDDISCKTAFILSLLDDLIPKGHHVLIFSQTRKMLNIIQESLVSHGYEFMRIDGTTKACDRLKIVNDFQEGRGGPIFLLTSQVGGLGLTLTRADRVIVVDPAWNPSTDNQSVDRAYRIGQKKDVVVYRLMTCATVEEKIYRMQIFKGGLFKTATEHKEQTRYFSKQDLRELFSLPKQGFDISLTQQQLLEEHDQQYKMEESLKSHVEFLKSLGIAGVSQHSLLFSKTAPVPVPQEEEVSRVRSTTFIINSTSHPSVEHLDGAQYAFKPKDVQAQPKKLSSHSSESTEIEIRERINRLSQMMANKETMSRLPDRGERIYKQIAELKLELDSIQEAKTTENKTIQSNDVSGLFQKVLNLKI